MRNALTAAIMACGCAAPAPPAKTPEPEPAEKSPAETPPTVLGPNDPPRRELNIKLSATDGNGKPIDLEKYRRP